MLVSAKGNLTIINAHTDEPKVFWRGTLLTNVGRVHVHSDEDHHMVKIVLSNGSQQEIYSEMMAAGIAVKNMGA